MLTKILSKRLQEILPDIVASHQLGYVKTRNIEEAIRIIDDMIFHPSFFIEKNVFLLWP